MTQSTVNEHSETKRLKIKARDQALIDFLNLGFIATMPTIHETFYPCHEKSVYRRLSDLEKYGYLKRKERINQNVPYLHYTHTFPTAPQKCELNGRVYATLLRAIQALPPEQQAEVSIMQVLTQTTVGTSKFELICTLQVATHQLILYFNIDPKYSVKIQNFNHLTTQNQREMIQLHKKLGITPQTEIVLIAVTPTPRHPQTPVQLIAPFYHHFSLMDGMAELETYLMTKVQNNLQPEA